MREGVEIQCGQVRPVSDVCFKQKWYAMTDSVEAKSAGKSREHRLLLSLAIHTTCSSHDMQLTRTCSIHKHVEYAAGEDSVFCVEVSRRKSEKDGIARD